ncbi:hypothetical protein LNK82_12290 [Saccharothrix sp. NEAU-S10]|nr:hypothetical protein [Saccharothrix luteola]MCC8245071.1 hypothetical protein [Saccharothrix luteola]
MLVETFGDGVVAELLVVAPLRDQGDGLGADPVGFEAGLGDALLRLRGIRMAQRLGLVPVGRLADVVALAHVGAGAAPGQLQHVEHFVLGHGLVDPPLQDLLRAAAGEDDRFVGGEHRHVGAFQFPFHREGLVHLARETRHRLADHHVEPSSRLLDLGQEIGDAAVARDRDVELVVSGLAAPVLQFHPAGLDVVEVAHDHPRCWQRHLRPFELSQQRLPWILVLLGRGPANPGDPNFLRLQGQRHAERGHRQVTQPAAGSVGVDDV